MVWYADKKERDKSFNDLKKQLLVYQEQAKMLNDLINDLTLELRALEYVNVIEDVKDVKD